MGIKVIIGSRDVNKGKKAVEELSSLGVEAESIQYDAFDLKAPKKIFNYINDKYKKLDILINNAGVLLSGNLFVTNSSTVSDKDIKEHPQISRNIQTILYHIFSQVTVF